MPATVTPSNAPTAPVRRAVVVLGMHRSGTSAVAGCLHGLGVDFGPRLMPATEDNPRGYYEHIDIVNLHDRLLLALGGSWDETRALPPDWLSDDALTGRYRADLLDLLRRDLPTAPLWGLKDPRLCRLLPWWEPVWTATNTRPLYVIVRRHPAEVAASLARREGFSAGKSHLLWLLHVVEAERATRSGQRVFLNFKDFLENWQTALEPVRAALDQPWPTPVAGSFVDPALSRSSVAADDSCLPLWVQQADAALELGRTGQEAEIRMVFDRLADSLAAAATLYGATEAERSADLRHQLETTRRQARWYEAEWHKARRRTQSTNAKKNRTQTSSAAPISHYINNEKYISNMIIHNISFMRIMGAFLGGRWKKFTNFR